MNKEEINKRFEVKKELEKAELRGVGKILDILWSNSCYSMGEKANKRIEEEMIYYFGENWARDMYNFIEIKDNGRLIEPVKTLEDFQPQQKRNE